MVTSSNISVQTSLQREATRQLAALQKWPHWPEIGLVAAKEYAMSQEQYEKLLPEYLRFLILAMRHHGIGMFSRQIDLIWHSHILATRRYQEFAETFNAGKFIHHLPQIGPKADLKCSVCKSCRDCNTPHYNEDENSVIAGSEVGTLGHFCRVYLEAFGVVPSSLWELSQISGEPEGCVL